jgi:hypothetical protein
MSPSAAVILVDSPLTFEFSDDNSFPIPETIAESSERSDDMPETWDDISDSWVLSDEVVDSRFEMRVPYDDSVDV